MPPAFAPQPYEGLFGSSSESSDDEGPVNGKWVTL